VRVSGRSLKRVCCIQIQRIRCASRIARTSSEQHELWGLRTVSNVRVKSQAQQWVIIKNSIRCAEHALTVFIWIPSQANARNNIVVVPRNSLSNSEEALSG